MKFVSLNKTLFILFFSLFILGCEERYNSKIYDNSLHVKLNEKIKIICENEKYSNYLLNLLTNRTLKSDWKMLCYDSGLYACSNPRSTDKTHSEGYIRLSLFKKDTEVYRIQYNYIEKKEKYILKKMIKQMLKEVGE